MQTLQEKAAEWSGVDHEDAFAIDQTNLYQKLGLQTFINLSTDFYTRVYEDEEEWFRSIFADSKKEDAIQNQYEFFVQRMGGPPLFSQRRDRDSGVITGDRSIAFVFGMAWHPALIGRHRPFEVTHKAAERWLHHMQQALDNATDIDQESKTRMLNFFRHTAYFLVAGNDLKNQSQGAPPVSCRCGGRHGGGPFRGGGRGNSGLRPTNTGGTPPFRGRGRGRGKGRGGRHGPQLGLTAPARKSSSSTRTGNATKKTSRETEPVKQPEVGPDESKVGTEKMDHQESKPWIKRKLRAGCNTQEVFDRYTAGKKHMAKLKRFKGHQAMYGPLSGSGSLPSAPNPLSQRFDPQPAYYSAPGSYQAPSEAYIPTYQAQNPNSQLSDAPLVFGTQNDAPEAQTAQVLTGETHADSGVQ
ncbi:two-on-two hemoglobin-3 [Tanacetum coccineum]